MAATNTKPQKIPYYKDVDGFRIPGIFSEDAYRSALEYKPRPDDLVIVTYPKCGSTWLQNIIACIYREGRPFQSALEYLTSTPFLELTGAEAAENMKRPGAIKFHLPFWMTPYSPEAKYIFVARNPKDVCVSFYHHTRNIPGYYFEDGEFEDYFELFIEGDVDFGDYFDTTLSWYEHRNDPNVLFITYEELKRDNRAAVLRIAEFMGPQYKEALEKNEQLLQDVMHHSGFKFMKEHLNRQLAEMSNLPKEMILNNPDLPPGIRAILGTGKPFFQKDADSLHFVRKGIVGDWRNHFTPMQNARMEKKFRDRTRDTDLYEMWKYDM